MEQIKNPATPEVVTDPPKQEGTEQPSATPGNQGQGSPQPSGDTPPVTPKGDEGQNQEGKVTISTKEYRDLQRNNARLTSIQRRNALSNKGRAPGMKYEGKEGDDPELVDSFNHEQEEHIITKKKLLQADVKNGISELLNKEEFKRLPGSTRRLIMKNPASLSTAETYDEAMLDIEDFIREEVAGLPPEDTTIPAPGAVTPPGHDTPPKPDGGTPAAADPKTLEDVSGKTGVDRSRALIRNAIKEKKGVTQV